jgi:membrane-associated phospholipid phosphatase
MARAIEDGVPVNVVTGPPEGFAAHPETRSARITMGTNSTNVRDGTSPRLTTPPSADVPSASRERGRNIMLDLRMQGMLRRKLQGPGFGRSMPIFRRGVAAMLGTLVSISCASALAEEATKSDPAKSEPSKPDAASSAKPPDQPPIDAAPKTVVLEQHFTVDPVADGVLIAAGAGTAGLLELILSTGEIVPQKPGSPDNLLPFDRIAVTQTVDPNALLYSNIGLGLALGFAALDPFLSASRDGWDAALVDGMMYAESLSLTLMFTDMTKMAVRRPRPLAYTDQAAIDKAAGGTGLGTPITSTNDELSFFSGHAATAAATTATATYLAFLRSPHTWRPWVTLAVGTLLTGFISVERVRGGAHFPTDVVAGSLAGAGIGVLVPHLHRQSRESPFVWVGLAPTNGNGGSVTLQGIF